MATKVLVTAIGQQIIADVKQVENKESKEVIGYWLTNPRVVGYKVGEDEQVTVNFGSYCLVSNDTEFSVRADHVVSILEPRPEVLERYELVVNPPEPGETEVTDLEDTIPFNTEDDATESDTTEDG